MTNFIRFIFFTFLLNLCTTSVQCGKPSSDQDLSDSKTSLTKKTQGLKYDLTADLRLHRFTHGDIIYVYGSSTSGKSTFTRELASCLPDYTLVSTRELKTKYMMEIINEICPKEYNYVSQYISTDDILIYLFEGINPVTENSCTLNNYQEISTNLFKIKDKEELLKKRYHPVEELYYIYHHVFKLSEKNKNVIVDNLDVSIFLQYIYKHNIHAPIHFLLLYCPVDILLERAIERNNRAMKGDLRDKRPLMRPLETFIDIYQNTHQESFIDKVSRNSLIKSFYTAYLENRREKGTQNKWSWEQIVNTLNSKFGTSIYIQVESKYPYAKILDTSKGMSEELIAELQQLTSCRPNSNKRSFSTLINPKTEWVAHVLRVILKSW